MRKIAYEIRQRTEADYRFFRFQTESALLDELDHNLKITDGVLRFRIFKVDPALAGDRAAAADLARELRAARAARAAGWPGGRPPRPHPTQAGPTRHRRPRPRRPREPPAESPAETTRARPSRAPRRPPSLTRARQPEEPAGRLNTLVAAFTPCGGRERADPRLRLGTVKTSFEEGLIRVAATNINVVVVTGNLTRDPELRSLPSGTSVCKMRIAVNSRRKDGATGEWVDKPNYFDVTVWGAQGENCATYLSKGRPVAVEGRLEWREWEAQDGSKRQAVEIIADSVQFLGSRGDSGGGDGNGVAAQSDVPADTSDFEGSEPAAVGASDDDIPF